MELVYLCSSMDTSLNFLHIARALRDKHCVEVVAKEVAGNGSEWSPLDEQMCIHLEIQGDESDVRAFVEEALAVQVKTKKPFTSTCPKKRHTILNDSAFLQKLNSWLDE